jgi:hypothetical protein
MGVAGHFFKADRVEVVITVWLQVLAAADTGVGLNGAAAAWLVGG